MNGKEYTANALRTESKPGPDLLHRLDTQARQVHAFFGLLTEVGELADAVKRHIFYGAPLDRTNIKEEAGDVFWYLAILLDDCGVSFEDCMVANIAKLKARYPGKFDAGQAVNRDLGAERQALEGKLLVEIEDLCDE